MFSSYEEVIAFQQQNLNDLRSLHNRLGNLPQSLNEYGIQKLNSVCFVPAKLYHTNEILVHLGNDYFAERSAKQAQDILSRRIQIQEKNISNLETQKKNKQMEMSSKNQNKTNSTISSPNLQQEVKKKKIDQKNKIIDICEPIQDEKPVVKQEDQKVIKNADPTTLHTQPIPSNPQPQPSPPQQLSSFDRILDMVEKGEYNIEDYLEKNDEESDEETDEKIDRVSELLGPHVQSIPEVNEEEIPETVNKKLEYNTNQQTKSILKPSSYEPAKKKIAFFDENKDLQLSPEEKLKEQEFKTKQRLQEMKVRANELSKTNEPEYKEKLPGKNENIMEKIKPTEFDDEQEEQPKKISKFKQRMLEKK